MHPPEEEAVLRDRAPSGLRDFRAASRRLRDFEPWGAVWRAAIALLRLGAEQVLPVAGAVLVALVTVSGRVAQAGVSAVLVLLVNRLLTSLRMRLLWHAPVTERLACWEASNARTEVPVLLVEHGVSAARQALRRAGFNPRIYAVRHGIAPANAAELTHEIKVHEPAAFPQSRSDDDRVHRIALALTAARVRARVAGLDVW